MSQADVASQVQQAIASLLAQREQLASREHELQIALGELDAQLAKKKLAHLVEGGADA